MGLFPEASNCGNSGNGTPKVKRKLFSAASEILSAVSGSSKSGNVAGSSESANKINETIHKGCNSVVGVSDKSSTLLAAVTLLNGTGSSCTSNRNQMQQLSTSWEFLR